MSTEFGLIETVLWTPTTSYKLLKKHLQRLMGSAHYFEIPFTKKNILYSLRELHKELLLSSFTPQRIRLVLSKNGKVILTHNDYTIEHKILKSTFARYAIHSDNQFLYHKTTDRQIYQNVMLGVGLVDDVIMYNEKGELTEFTIGNLVLSLENKLFTPALHCGLLPGCLRSKLLATNKIQERVLYKSDIQYAQKIFRINALRGWQSVVMQ